MLEHRWSERLATQHDVLLRVRDLYAVPGKIRNVSRHGLYVEASTILNPNTCVHAQFLTPGAPQGSSLWHDLTAVVVHSQDRGMGLMVNVNDAASRAAMLALIEKYGFFNNLNRIAVS